MSGYNTLNSLPASPLCVGTGVPGCTLLLPPSHGSWGPTKLSDLLSQRLDLLSPFICLPGNTFTWSSLQPQTNKYMEEVFNRDHSDKAKDKKVAAERSSGVEKVSCKYASEIQREGFSSDHGCSCLQVQVLLNQQGAQFMVIAAPVSC